MIVVKLKQGNCTGKCSWTKIKIKKPVTNMINNVDSFSFE